MNEADIKSTNGVEFLSIKESVMFTEPNHKMVYRHIVFIGHILMVSRNHPTIIRHRALRYPRL